MIKIFNCILNSQIKTEPTYMFKALKKMNTTIQRLEQTQHLSLFQTDYLE